MSHLVPFVAGLLAATGSAGLADRGVFPELDTRVAIALPAWVPHAPVERLLRWLDPAAHPLLVQLPRAAFCAVAKSWALPVENP